jgi:hypothetical protein
MISEYKIKKLSVVSINSLVLLYLSFNQNLSSLIFFVICCKLFKGLKSKNIISYAILLAAFTYSIQSFFNLSVVFVTPLFYLVLALLNDCIINKKEL